MNKKFYVYILASKTGVLYIGVTNNLERRLNEHKLDLIDGFTNKYKCHKLVYIEEYSNPRDAISREKQLKNWGRRKKEFIINQQNSNWKDLSL